MKRPLLWLAMGVVFGEILIYVLDIFQGVILLVFAAYIIRRLTISRQIVSILLIGIVIGITITSTSIYQINQSITSDAHVLKASIKNIETYEDYSKLLIIDIVDMDSGKSIYGGMKLIVKKALNDTIQYGDTLVFTSVIEKLNESRNQGGFNEKNYYYGQGIYYEGDCRDIKFVNQSLHNGNFMVQIQRAMDRLNHYLSEVIDMIWTQEISDMVKTMVLGKKSSMNEAVLNKYQEVGLAHILAISGLHLSIIILGLYQVIKRRIRPFGEWLVLAVMFMYILLTDAHISTIRAGIMVGLYIMSVIIKKQYEPFASLITAILVLTVMNPYQIYQVGFLLSISAVIGIILVGPRIDEKFKNILISLNIVNDQIFKLQKSITPLIGILIMTGPILVYAFYGMSMVSVPVNLLMIPVVTIFLLISIISIVTFVILPEMGRLLGEIVSILHRIITILIEFFYQIPGHYLVLGKPHFIIIVIYYSVFIYILKTQDMKNILNLPTVKKNTYYKIIFSILCMVLCISMIAFNRLSITHLDVGQGDCCVITYMNKTWLVDSGGETCRLGMDNVGITTVLPYLKANGIKCLEGVFITHSDFDHLYGLIEIMPYIEIKCIYMPSSYRVYNDAMLDILHEKLQKFDITVEYIEGGSSFEYYEMTLSCLYPLDDEIMEDNNDHSLVLKLSRGAFDYVLTGDITGVGEQKILDAYVIKGVEGMKVAHHGSVSSSLPEFIEALNPEIAVISVAENNLYGHPANQTLQTYETIETQIYQTKDLGAITIVYDGFLVYYMDSMYGQGKEFYLCN